jgi:hypothetical protein
MANAAVPGQKWGTPGTKGFESNYMTVMRWYDSFDKQTHKLYCHKLAAPYFKAFLEELSKIYDIKSLGAFNVRKIGGSSRMSQHSWGNAIDINPLENPRRKPLKTDMPPNIIALAAKHNLEWGGTWKSLPDSMHFEYRG